MPTRYSLKAYILLIGLVVGYYLADNLDFFSFLDFKIYNNIIKPCYWGVVIVIALKIPRIGPRSKLRLRDTLYFWAISFAVIHVVLWFAGGFIDGFGKSPYDLTAFGIFINLLVQGTMLVGIELIRSYLVNSITKKENFFFFILIAIFFTLISFPIKRYTVIKDFQDSIKFISEFLIPSFSKNLMAVYLAFIGGPIASMCYVGIINIIEYISPILPDLRWITSAFIGILCPVFSLMGIQSIYKKHSKSIKKFDKEKESTLGWFFTSLFSIGIIWFTVGVFPIYPSVIATGSMEPVIKPGDVIIIDKVWNLDIQEGDIIQFKQDDILISHRIIEIVENKEGTFYRTKGDNNASKDMRLIGPEDIKGKVVYVVPKIGWPTLLLKSNKRSIEDIDF